MLPGLRHLHSRSHHIQILPTCQGESPKPQQAAVGRLRPQVWHGGEERVQQQLIRRTDDECVQVPAECIVRPCHWFSRFDDFNRLFILEYGYTTWCWIISTGRHIEDYF